MNCLCCGKPLKKETESGWHVSCIKHFFGTDMIPEIDIKEQTLTTIAVESIQKGFTVPGVQKKLSLHLLSEKNKPRLTLVNYPTGYILKPQVEQFEALPEAEQLVMTMADTIGISTVPHALMRGDGDLAYITRRVDRVPDGEYMKMLAMEDFCQLDLRLTQDKYKGSYERCAKIIERYSCRKGLDMAELFMRLVFCFVAGNSDMHLKNFSLIETGEGTGTYSLSPAYDLLPVNVIMPEDKEQFALAMNGKKRNLHRKDFLVYADACGISRVSAEKMLDAVIEQREKFVAMCEASLLPVHSKERFEKLIQERCDAIAKRTQRKE